MTTKKRLLIIHPAPAPYRVDLFNALAKRFTLKVVFLDDHIWYQTGAAGTWFKDIKFDFEYFAAGFSLGHRRIPLGISACIAAFHPDVVVTSEFGYATSVLALKSGAFQHVVWTADSPDVIRGESRFRSLWRRFLIPRIQALILYSEETKEFYRGRFDFKGTAGICPNVQSEKEILGKVASAAAAARRCLLKYGLRGTKALLYTGRLAPEKRVDRLMEAFAQIAKTDACCRLVLVGSGPERAGLESMAGKMGLSDRVLFTGHLEGPEFYAWLRIGAVLALPSVFEPWGAVVNEALVAGIPAVVSNVVGAKLLIQNGVNGTVLDPRQGRELEKALVYWLSKAEPLTLAGIMKKRRSKIHGVFESAFEGFAEAVESNEMQKAG